MHDGSKQRWLFERGPGIALLRSKRPGVVLARWLLDPHLLPLCCSVVAVVAYIDICFQLWHAQTDPGHDASRARSDGAESGWAGRDPPPGMGVKPFCGFGYFCQENSTEMVAIAYNDLPVGRGWILHALFSVVFVSTFMRQACYLELEALTTGTPLLSALKSLISDLSLMCIGSREYWLLDSLVRSHILTHPV